METYAPNPAGVLASGIRPIAVLRELSRQCKTFTDWHAPASSDEAKLARQAARQADELRRTLEKLDSR